MPARQLGKLVGTDEWWTFSGDTKSSDLMHEDRLRTRGWGRGRGVGETCETQEEMTR